MCQLLECWVHRAMWKIIGEVLVNCSLVYTDLGINLVKFKEPCFWVDLYQIVLGIIWICFYCLEWFEVSRNHLLETAWNTVFFKEFVELLVVSLMVQLQRWAIALCLVLSLPARAIQGNTLCGQAWYCF